MGTHSILPLWWLNQIKVSIDLYQPDAQLSLTSSSTARRVYCYAKLAIFFPNNGRNHRQYWFHLPTEGWPGWVVQGGLLHSEKVHLPERTTTNRAK